MLNYLCFWCLYSIRMGRFVPVTTFNSDLTLKNRRLRHILKETEKFAEYVDEFDSSRLWILYRTRSDANDHKEYLSFYKLFPVWIVPLTLRVHSFSLTFFLWDKQNSVTNESPFWITHDIISSQGTVKIGSFTTVSLCFIATKPHLTGIRHTQNHWI